jgi:hypothetical protein
LATAVATRAPASRTISICTPRGTFF